MRTLARRDAAGVRLITRHGNDFTSRFPLIVAAVAALPSVLALALSADGVEHRQPITVGANRFAVDQEPPVLVAFDLIELDGRDLRRSPIEYRKRMLAKLVRGPRPGIVVNEHYEGDGEVVFQHACALGCEGIVSKRLGSLYRSGRSQHWLKIKNPAAPAVRREAEADWGHKRQSRR